MTWNIAWSWQADARIATMTAVEGGVLVSTGLNLVMLEANGDVRWNVEVPFKVHAAAADKGTIGLLAAHGFYLMSSSNGNMVHGEEARPGGSVILCIDQVAVGHLPGAKVKSIFSRSKEEVFDGLKAGLFAD